MQDVEVVGEWLRGEAVGVKDGKNFARSRELL
jgi:hypothetical protein